MRGLSIDCIIHPFYAMILAILTLNRQTGLCRISLELQVWLEERFLHLDQVRVVAQELRRMELLVPNSCCGALEMPADLLA